MSGKQQTDIDVDALEKAGIIDELAERIVEKHGGVSRRGVLAGAGAGGLAALLGVSGTAAAGTNQVGTLGTATNPVDLYGEDIFLQDAAANPSSNGQMSMNGVEVLAQSSGTVRSFDTLGISVVASGQVALSSGTAIVSTGITATDATFSLALGIDDPNADAKVAGRLFWDDSAGQYKVEIVEDGTSVNPTVNYDVTRVR